MKGLFCPANLEDEEATTGLGVAEEEEEEEEELVAGINGATFSSVGGVYAGTLLGL